MASYQEGYDDTRFQSPVPENLRCGICLCVLRKPMQCVRNEHSFCQPCITRHLQETATSCPTCIEPLTLETLRPSRIISQFVSQLLIRCDNSRRGCQESVKVEMLEGHVANCEFGAVKCCNEGCEEVTNRAARAEHENNECGFRKRRCEVCGDDVAYKKRKLHCYVTKKELDEVKEEISSVKEIVLNMSREVTHHMGQMKDQMNEMKREIAAVKEECHHSKAEASSSATFHSTNMKEDIIVAGGGGLQSVEMFSWTTRQWTLLSPMTSLRWFPSSFVHEGQMFVCGGMGSGDTIESLEIKEEGAHWKEVEAKLPQKTWGHASIVYNEHVYIFGGKSGGNAVSNIYKVSLVSPYSSQLVCNLPEPRCHHGAQRFGNQVTIVGGTTTGRPSDSLDSVLLYDITRNCCRTLAPLPFAVCNMATVALGDSIIIIGGRDKNGDALHSVVSYNVKEQKSKMLPSMKQKRELCTAVVTDNVIVAIGGLNEGYLNSVECFNICTYVWEDLPSMKKKRYGSTAVVKCNF